MCAKELFVLLHLPFYVFVGNGLCYQQYNYTLLYLGINRGCSHSLTIGWHHIYKLHYCSMRNGLEMLRISMFNNNNCGNDVEMVLK